VYDGRVGEDALVTRFAALMLAAIVALLAGATEVARTGVVLDPAALLRTYEPVLQFHPDEDWAPEPPETFLAQARLERQVARGAWATVPQPPLPTTTSGCTSTPCFRLNLPCALKSGDACYERAASATDWRRPVIYGRVVDVPAGAPSPPGFTEPPRYLVRYWLFYEFDDWHSLRKRLWQTHEGDWESISIGISATGTPAFAAYSQHCSGSVRTWTSVTKRGGTHPVAYVGLGSHANLFTKTPTSTRFSECARKGLAYAAAAKVTRLVQLAQDRILDRTGSAHAMGPDDLPGVTPLRIIPLDPSKTEWARFPGRWSEGQILWLGSVPRTLTTVSQGSGPATPRWTSSTISSLWHSESS